MLPLTAVPRSFGWESGYFHKIELKTLINQIRKKYSREIFVRFINYNFKRFNINDFYAIYFAL